MSKRDLVVRRPSLPTIRNPFTPKPTSIIAPSNSASERSLENDNYHHEFVSPFSLTDEESSSGSSSPRDEDQEQEEPEEDRRPRGPGAILDRLRSGISSTRGFQRFWSSSTQSFSLQWCIYCFTVSIVVILIQISCSNHKYTIIGYQSILLLPNIITLALAFQLKYALAGVEYGRSHNIFQDVFVVRYLIWMLLCDMNRLRQCHCRMSDCQISQKMTWNVSIRSMNMNIICCIQFFPFINSF